MKSSITLILGFMLLSIVSLSTLAQEKTETECKVLKQQICVLYKGECKKGLAHGKGTAQGLDLYVGSFKKGLPNGIGTYKWSTGEIYEGRWKNGQRNGEGKYRCIVEGKDSILDGIWKNDKYLGKEPVSPKQLMALNINSISFSRVGDGNKITLSIMQGGTNNSSTSNLILTSTSGNQFANGVYFGVEQVVYPVSIRVSYSSSNLLRSGRFDCVGEFVITQSGNWNVTFNN